jgi:DNA-binding Xre family transcriptional regulator
MEKKAESAAAKPKARVTKRSPYIGVTRDGVKIIRPTGPVDNITLAQARKAVATVRALRIEAASKG